MVMGTRNPEKSTARPPSRGTKSPVGTNRVDALNANVHEFIASLS